MAHWHDVAVTNDGVAMLNEMMAGKKLCLTSAYGGTGIVDTAVLGDQTAMVDQKQKLALIDEKDGPDGKTVTVQISSVGNSAEYLLRQIGVYAKLEGATEEKLLFLMQDEGVVIPDETEENFLLEIYCTLRIGKNAKLTVTIDPTGIVTLQRMKDALDKYRTLWEDSDPTAATVGTVGQHYLNIVTKKEFVCVAASEEGYIWQVSGTNTADDITVGGKPLTEVLGTVEPEEGTSAPTEQTAGVVGQKYTDTSTGKVYTCIAVSLGEDGGTRYTWVEGSLGTLADVRTALLDVSATLEHKAELGQAAAAAAQAAAMAAQDTANAANAAAGTAQTAAAAAQNTANVANAAAGTAQAAATTAQNTANAANTAAGTAQATANTALATANSAVTVANAKANIVYGTYAGTNTSGAESPNSLTFPFQPKFVVIKVNNTGGEAYTFLAVYGCPSTFLVGNISGAYAYNVITWSGNTMQWYNYYGSGSNSGYQMNQGARNYYYVAIG